MFDVTSGCLLICFIVLRYFVGVGYLNCYVFTLDLGYVIELVAFSALWIVLVVGCLDLYLYLRLY